MKKIEKKLDAIYFEAILDGRKILELRLNDFDIQEGDELVLREWDPRKRIYIGRILAKKVGYIGKFKPEEITHWSQEEIKSKGLQIISLLDSSPT